MGNIVARDIIGNMVRRAATKYGYNPAITTGRLNLNKKAALRIFKSIKLPESPTIPCILDWQRIKESVYGFYPGTPG